jgi:hypothetical protein
MSETQANRDRSRLKRELYQRTQSAPVIIEGESQIIPDRSGGIDFDALDSVLRVLVGGTMEVTDLALKMMRSWEEAAATNSQELPVPDNETTADLMRYLLIGLLFDTQHRVRRGVASAGGLLGTIAGAAVTVTRPVANSRLLAPARRRAGTLSDQALDEMVRLIQTGRREELLGRLASRSVADDSIDLVIDYLAANPEVVELVRQQSTGMASQLATAVRERTVTSDSVFEAVVRKLLRKPPRADLPGAPDVIKMQVRELDDSKLVETS